MFALMPQVYAIPGARKPAFWVISFAETLPELLDKLDSPPTNSDNIDEEPTWSVFRRALDMAIENLDRSSILVLKKFLVSISADLYNHSGGKYRNWTAVEHAMDPDYPDGEELAIWSPSLTIIDGRVTDRQDSDPITFW